MNSDRNRVELAQESRPPGGAGEFASLRLCIEFERIRRDSRRPKTKVVSEAGERERKKSLPSVEGPWNRVCFGSREAPQGPRPQRLRLGTRHGARRPGARRRCSPAPWSCEALRRPSSSGGCAALKRPSSSSSSSSGTRPPVWGRGVKRGVWNCVGFRSREAARYGAHVVKYIH